MDEKSLEFEGELSLLSSDVWACGIFVPDHIASHFIGKKEKRVVCTLNEKHHYQCALMPAGDDRYFINVNKEAQKKLNIEPGSSVNVSIVADESEYGLPVPEEWNELLNQDIEGRRLFHQLTKGKQRTLLHIVGKPKSTEVRIKKALVIIEHLKTRQGNLDFKILNQDFKDANNRFR